MWARVGLVAVAGWLTAACYQPSALAGLPCSSAGTCPGDQVCDLTQAPPLCVDNLGDAGAHPDGPPPTCTVSAQCPSTVPVCDPAAGVCRGCIADAECGSDVCHELAGTCVDEASALYVAPGGVANSSCTRSLPCASIDAALSLVTATRHTIRVGDGTYTDNFRIKSMAGMAVVISGTDRGPAGATLSPSIGQLETDGNALAVLEGLTIANTSGAGFINRGTATLSRIEIDKAGGTGVDNRGTLTVRDCRIEESMNAGITSSDLIDVRRTELLRNVGGGISASSGFTIINTVIASNGGFGSLFGGAKLAPVAGKPAVFRFSTVTANTGGSSSGIQCDQPVTVEDSIVAANASLIFPELSAMCSARYSLFGATLPAGPGNLQGSPMFVTDSSDFHLRAGSPAIDSADPAATEAEDLEGVARPAGAARDIGAYERP